MTSKKIGCQLVKAYKQSVQKLGLNEKEQIYVLLSLWKNVKYFGKLVHYQNHGLVFMNCKNAKNAIMLTKTKMSKYELFQRLSQKNINLIFFTFFCYFTVNTI